MASNAREDTQSNSVAPNDNEVEVQSNANPTSETPQATDNVSTPEGSTPNEGDNKTHVKSAYWEYFDRLKVEGEWKAKCKFCKNVLSANPRNGTKSLRNHVDRYCKRIKVANSRQSSIVESLSKQSQKQKVNEDGFVFDPSFTRKCVAEMIILHEYPMSCVDHHGLRRAFASMQPTFKMPSRNTIRKDILKMYGDEKQKLTLQLDENDSRVAITSDMWTSNQEKGYMVVTAHYIDTSWKLHMRLLSFCYVPCPHTSEVLTETLMKILLEWNIDRKLSTVTLDNCSTNDAMIDGLLGRLDSSFLMLGGKLLHMHCCAHILNLIVKDGLSIVKESIEKIRSSVLYWTATQKRTETFVSWCAKTATSFTRKLVLDCPTRWNSTYLMLETALLYKAVFPRLRQKEPQYKTVPSNEEWELAKEICDRLKLFYDVTQLFFGSKFPTANLYFTLVCKIKVSLDEWEISTNPLIANMASNMKKKFDKYWDEIHGIMGVAAVLDPRYKMVGVEFQFEKMYPDPTECSKQVDRIHQLCNELVNEYTQKMSSDVSHVGVGVGVGTKELNESRNASLFGGDDYMVYLKRRKMTRSSYVNVKFDHYLEEEIHPPNDPNFNVLKWWKNNQMKFKVLAKIAKDIYAIPVSTIASESAFSTSGRGRVGVGRVPAGAGSGSVIYYPRVIFPLVWTNTCCSHPLYRESVLIEENALDVSNAAQSKLLDDLGIVAEDVTVDWFLQLGRILYKELSDGKWGEHELLFLSDPTNYWSRLSWEKNVHRRFEVKLQGMEWRKGIGERESSTVVETNNSYSIECSTTKGSEITVVDL
ncbi:zinc finger BED domain-containing protein RICESLEEPER 1-like [Arachis ipaensis]|uniref:zinc finger BED domain-containing protein RICESLEEPER 1-like n=1 Tax=Arachis ipaensis TaxID=130454 RepID=UPI000A2AFAC3|nr:zinc finger BED domain-containing protein RICESLEEPER 1-like [Arachis ipaensis]